ncbi:hypothetical protein ABZW32_15600 [Streptomyces sp. NPDC004667]|uniref:hypothetical protein n=1 Tax=Streptomyces sp. NPDC004667 TaxID=3154285 RepID=UPI0033BC382E
MREGLALLLGPLPGIEVLASAADGAEAVRLVAAVSRPLRPPARVGLKVASAVGGNKSVAAPYGVPVWFRTSGSAATCRSRTGNQEVRTLMTVTETGTARIQEFIIVATSVASG